MVTEIYKTNKKAKQIVKENYKHTPKAYVRTFGCQQSVHDGEQYKGVLQDIGFDLTDSPGEADVIIFNTCAVREHAEQRLYGNLGALKALKEARSGVLLGIAGCMPQQKDTIDKLRASYPFVDMVMGSNAIDELPDLIVEKLTTRKKALRLPPIRETVIESMPAERESTFKAFLPVMYGCDNYCSYCIVPYVRGPERSRSPLFIEKEFSLLLQQGYKDITLLGQNVNSYGKGLEEDIDFSDLLGRLAETEGDYRVRFMTSHPKDATRKMIDTIAQHDRISKHLHLPIQSGSDDILARMNRQYTVEEYLNFVEYGRSVCPEMTFSSDVMVGFPGETDEDFEKTLEVVEKVGFTQLFTFIYSPRIGTQAADLPDGMPHKDKVKRLEQLMALQDEQSEKVMAPWVGQTFRVLVENEGREDGTVVGRLDNNALVEFAGDTDLIGKFTDVTITKARLAMLDGELAK